MTDAAPPTSDADRIAALEAKIARLEALVAAPAPAPAPAPADTAPEEMPADAAGSTSRRHVLRHLAVAAAGGAVAATVGGAPPAAAATFMTDDLMNTATGFTRLNTDSSASGVAVLFQSTFGTTGFTNADSAYGAALGGWSVTDEQPHGVYGYSQQADGYGVVGSAEGTGGVGVRALGPTGLHATGSSVGIEVSSTSGVAIDADGGSGTGVQATGQAVGGQFSGGTAGVVAEASSGPGLTASGTSGAGLSGTDAALRLLGADKVLLALFPDKVSTATKRVPPPSRTTAHTRGMLDLDKNYDLWLCVADGTPGTWRKLTGPTAAGSFHAVTPGRVYDSRSGLPGPATPLTLGATRTITVANRRDLTTGEVVQTDFVPAGATAISCNVTVVSTTGAGYLVANPGGVTAVGASTINWSTSGQILNNGVILTLNTARELTLVAGGSSGSSAHVVVDVTGYYR